MQYIVIVSSIASQNVIWVLFPDKTPSTHGLTPSVRLYQTLYPVKTILYGLYFINITDWVSYSPLFLRPLTTSLSPSRIGIAFHILRPIFH
jgi:hypothetical protein